MKRGFKTISLVLLILMAIYGCAEKKEEAGRAEPKKAREFSIELFDGATFRLSEHRGSPIVLNFWASWCGPCKREAPELEKAFKKYSPRGVVFLAIAVQDTEEDAKKFIEEHGLTLPTGLDREQSVAELYGVMGVPTTFIIDREGMIRYTHLGAVTEELLEDELEELLQYP